jgi:ABC-type nitrate/sulfonate/bicarbonate transport system substrate-binding protein
MGQVPRTLQRFDRGSPSVRSSQDARCTIFVRVDLYDAGDPTAGLLAVSTSSPIHSAKDFAGRTIGVAALNTVRQFAARAWIDRNGGDSTQVRFIETPFSEMAGEVGTARIDAASFDITADPMLDKPGDAFRLIAPSFTAVSPNFLPGCWIAASDWAAKNPAAVRAFSAAMRRAAAWANSHHGDSAAIVAKYSKLPLSLLQSVARVTYGTVLTPRLLQPNIDVAARYGALASNYDARELISKAVTS